MNQKGNWSRISDGDRRKVNHQPDGERSRSDGQRRRGERGEGEERGRKRKDRKEKEMREVQRHMNHIAAEANHGAEVNEAGCIRERWAPDAEERERWRVNQREEWNEVKGRGGGMYSAA